MLTSQTPQNTNSSQGEVKVRQRKTVRQRPLLGAPSLGFKLTNGSAAFVQKLSLSLEKVEQASDRRDASRAMLFLQQVYRGGRQYHPVLPAELQARVEDSLRRTGLTDESIVSASKVTFPSEMRDRLDRVLGIV